MIPDFLFRLLSTVVGIVIPAYRSYKALEYHDGQVHHYLKYWIVFGVFSLIEFWVDIVLFWIPFYNELKLGMLVWLQLPQTSGAVAVYDRVIKPLVNQHEDDMYATFFETDCKSLFITSAQI
jgi:receptor expression-enhancing protein 5/6